MTAAIVEEEEDMEMSEESEMGQGAREDDGADEELQPPGEDLNGKQQQLGGSNGGGGRKRKKQSSGQLRDEGEEWAQKTLVRISLKLSFWRCFILQVLRNELDSVRAEWLEDVEDKEKKIKLLQTAMQVGRAELSDFKPLRV